MRVLPLFVLVAFLVATPAVVRAGQVAEGIKAVVIPNYGEKAEAEAEDADSCGQADHLADLTDEELASLAATRAEWGQESPENKFDTQGGAAQYVPEGAPMPEAGPEASAKDSDVPAGGVEDGAVADGAEDGAVGSGGADGDVELLQTQAKTNLRSTSALSALFVDWRRTRPSTYQCMDWRVCSQAHFMAKQYGGVGEDVNAKKISEAAVHCDDPAFRNSERFAPSPDKRMVVRVSFHVVTGDSVYQEHGRKAMTAGIRRSFNVAKRIWGAHGIHLEESGVYYHDEPRLAGAGYSYFACPQGRVATGLKCVKWEDWVNTLRESRCTPPNVFKESITVFIAQDAVTPGVTGSALYPWDEVMSAGTSSMFVTPTQFVTPDNIRGTGGSVETLSHEIGHKLGLIHTFDSVELKKCPDTMSCNGKAGSVGASPECYELYPSATLGDLCEDTPPSTANTPCPLGNKKGEGRYRDMGALANAVRDGQQPRAAVYDHCTGRAYRESYETNDQFPIKDSMNIMSYKGSCVQPGGGFRQITPCQARRARCWGQYGTFTQHTVRHECRDDTGMWTPCTFNRGGRRDPSDRGAPAAPAGGVDRLGVNDEDSTGPAPAPAPADEAGPADAGEEDGTSSSSDSGSGADDAEPAPPAVNGPVVAHGMYGRAAPAVAAGMYGMRQPGEDSKGRFVAFFESFGADARTYTPDMICTENNCKNHLGGATAEECTRQFEAWLRLAAKSQ